MSFGIHEISNLHVFVGHLVRVRFGMGIDTSTWGMVWLV